MRKKLFQNLQVAVVAFATNVSDTKYLRFTWKIEELKFTLFVNDIILQRPSHPISITRLAMFIFLLKIKVNNLNFPQNISFLRPT